MILLFAIVLLFIVAAMAALAIDIVTIYTARSEAQSAADGAALAAARALASSGMTSNPSITLVPQAENLAFTVATQVATHNTVAGKSLSGSGLGPNCGQEICIVFNNLDTSFGTNPRLTVQVTRSDLPIFFARIWGSAIVTVKATATAEAYNPSGAAVFNPPAKPVSLSCVKPWVLPNMADSTTKIFDENTGAIQNASSLVGQSVDAGKGGLSVTCSGNCNLAQSGQAWQYFPGDQTSFPAPTKALPQCSVGLSLPYQNSVAGCVQKPVSCGDNTVGNSNVDLDRASNATDADAELAVDCLTHSQNNFGDRIDPTLKAGEPFQFVAGNDNPVAAAQGKDVMVSDSLVTLPVVDVSPGANFPANPVKVIGFVQLFLNPSGSATPLDHVPATIINLAGCGKNATGQPILGNGASPVAVRLIAP